MTERRRIDLLVEERLRAAAGNPITE